MNCVNIWFHQSFNELLSSGCKGGEFRYQFKGNPSLKHLVEAMRIPHTEIGKTFVNGREISLTYLAQDGDSIAVYPVIGNRRFHPDTNDHMASNEARFILDNHLGKLTIYLRMLGFDALYRNTFQDDELAELACKEARILLTRDRGLLMRRSIEYGYFIRSMNAQIQVVEVLQQYSLYNLINPFKRCLKCNDRLIQVEKNLIQDRLEPLTIRFYNEYRICQNCDQIYWKGSHFERMQNFISHLIENNFWEMDNG